MRITHALSYETRAENISLLRFFLDRLYDKFEFEVIIPRGSGYEKLFCPTRVKITELGIEDKRGNMLRDVYIYKQYFRSSGARIVHSHGSVCASVGALSSSYREVSLISDFCTVGTLGRIFSSLAPRAKNTLTLGYLPSDISFFESRGVPKEKIVYVPLCTERRRLTGGMRQSKPLVLTECRSEEECALACFFIDRLSDLCDAEYCITAPPGLVRRLNRRLSLLGLSRFAFATPFGGLSLEQIASASIFVSASSDRYALPLSALGCMYSGIPAVLPNTDRCKDVISGGRLGVLYSLGDPVSLCRAVSSLLSDIDALDGLRARVVTESVKLFSPEVSISRLASLYNRCYRD